MRRAALLAVVLMGAACGSTNGDGGGEAATSDVNRLPSFVAPSSTTSTSDVTTMAALEPTTTIADEAEALVLVQSNPTTRQPFDPGRVYTYDLNLVPVDFRFSKAGWQLIAVGNRSIWISHAAAPLAAFFSFRVGETPDELLDEIRSLGPDVARVGVEEAMVGQAEGVVLELPIGPPEADGPLPWLDSNWECGGYPLVEERILDARVTAIINPCSVNRVWVFGFDEASVFLNVLDYSGTKESAKTLDDLEPLIAELLAAISFGDAR